MYFYEVARKLGVDRLSETAKKFGLGKGSARFYRKAGVVPNTKWKKVYWMKLVFSETLHSGSDKDISKSTPLQLCLMTAQITNGGFKINPRIIFDEKNNNFKSILIIRTKIQTILFQLIYWFLILN